MPGCASDRVCVDQRHVQNDIILGNVADFRLLRRARTTHLCEDLQTVTPLNTSGFVYYYPHYYSILSYASTA